MLCKYYLYHYLSQVVLAEDMEFNGVVSKIDYNDEKGEIHVEGLSTPLGFRLIHMPPDTEFSLVREGDSVRVEIGFWNFVCIRKPPLPNAVTLVGEAAKRQRNFKRSNATQPSNHRDGGEESPRIPRRPALRRAASNSNLEDKTDDSDVPEPRSRTRSLEDGFSRRAYKGVVGSTSVTSLSQDPFCHAPINPHVPICPGAPCMISQHTFPTGNLTDARAFQGWNTMRSACQAAGFPHTTHHSGGAGLYHSGLHHQQFLAHPAANFYQRNSSVYRNEPNLLVELNAIEPEPLRAQGGPSTGDDTIIEMTVNELRDVVRRARARQI